MWDGMQDALKAMQSWKQLRFGGFYMDRRSFICSLIGGLAAAAVVGTTQAQAAPAPAPEPVAPPVPESAAVDPAMQAQLDKVETADSQYYYGRRRYYRPVRRVYYRRPVRRVYYRRPVRRVYYRRPVRRVIYRVY
jgi:hypothetical protein